MDYEDMTPVGPSARACGGCGEVVTDLSALDEPEARAHLARGPSCVRYVHDVDGNIVHHPPADAVLLPASALSSGGSRARWIAAASIAAAAPLLVACPGGVIGDQEPPDAGTSEPAGPSSISASSFAQTCTSDGECMAVDEGRPCCTTCGNAAINRQDEDPYTRALFAFRRSYCSADPRCPDYEPCLSVRPACVNLRCVLLDCDAGECDRRDAGGDAAPDGG